MEEQKANKEQTYVIYTDQPDPHKITKQRKPKAKRFTEFIGFRTTPETKLLLQERGNISQVLNSILDSYLYKGGQK